MRKTPGVWHSLIILVTSLQNERDDDNQTNFQKASCTEADCKDICITCGLFPGQTFKMLGMNKVASNDAEDDRRQGLGDGAEGVKYRRTEGMRVKKRRATVNTLEVPEAHSLKQLDGRLC